MTERDHVFEEARTAVVRLRAGVPAGTPMCLGNLLNAVLGRAEDAEKDRDHWYAKWVQASAMQARAEVAEKALAELEATLIQEDTAEIQFLKASIEDIRNDRTDAWNQRNAIYAELTKVQARAEAAEARIKELEAALVEIEQSTTLYDEANRIAHAVIDKLERKP